jgi:hypothetical protein
MKTLLVMLNHLIPALEAMRKDLSTELAQNKVDQNDNFQK